MCVRTDKLIDSFHTKNRYAIWIAPPRSSCALQPTDCVATMALATLRFISTIFWFVPVRAFRPFCRPSCTCRPTTRSQIVVSRGRVGASAMPSAQNPSWHHSSVFCVIPVPAGRPQHYANVRLLIVLTAAAKCIPMSSRISGTNFCLYSSVRALPLGSRIAIWWTWHPLLARRARLSRP